MRQLSTSLRASSTRLFRPPLNCVHETLGIRNSLFGLLGWDGLRVVASAPATLEQPAQKAEAWLTRAHKRVAKAWLAEQARRRTDLRNGTRRRLVVASAAVAAGVGLSLVVGGAADARTQGLIAFVRFTSQVGHPRVFVVGLSGGRPRMLRLPVAAAEAPVFSRDGRRLAFVGGTNRPGEADITIGAQLYIAKADGSEARLLTRDRSRKGGVAWSGNGRTLVFVRATGAGTSSSLWVVGADGRKARRLTYGGTDLEPSWSPDGQSIVFVRISKTYRSAVMVVRPDGSGLRQILAGAPNLSNPVWSPDGTRLLVQDGRTLFTAKPDGSSRRTLAKLSADAKGAIEDPQPTWSRNGRYVVFCQLRAGSVDRSDVWIVGADGRGLRRLTTSPGLDKDPSAG